MEPLSFRKKNRHEYLNSIHPAYVRTLTERSLCAVLYKRRGVSFEYREDPDGSGGFNYYLVSSMDQEDNRKRFYYKGQVLKSFRRIEAEKEYSSFLARREERRAMKDMISQIKAEQKGDIRKGPYSLDANVTTLNPEIDFGFVSNHQYP